MRGCPQSALPTHLPAKVPVFVLLIVMPLEEAGGNGGDQGPDGVWVSGGELSFDGRAQVADRVFSQPVEGVLSGKGFAGLPETPSRDSLQSVAD